MNFQMARLNIVAVDVDAFSDVSEVFAIAEVLAPEDPFMNATVDEHHASNAGYFAEKFPERMLDGAGLVLWKKTTKFIRLHANYLQYRSLIPLVYRIDAFFRRGSLEGLIQVVRRDSRVEDDEADKLWRAVSRCGPVIRELRWPIISDKARISAWVTNLCGAVKTMLPSAAARPIPQKRFGIKGALAYTEPGEINDGAGYIGKSDLCFGKEGSVVGVMELKIASDDINQVWYRFGAILPQIICWLGGTVTAKVGIVLCQLGFKLIYRDLTGNDHEGNPIFNYYAVNGIDGIHFEDCRGPEGAANRMILLRVFFELLLISMEDPVEERDAPSTPIKAQGPAVARQPPNPPLTAEKMREERVAKMRRLSEDSENGNLIHHSPCTQSDVGSAEESEIEIVSSYNYSVRLADDSLVPLVGFEFVEV